MLEAVGSEGLAAPAGSALVRVLADDGSWIHRLPPVPEGHCLTVSIGSAGQLAVSDQDLQASGYRIVGPQPVSSLPEAVEVLVPGSLMANHPDWWQRLLAVADRAFDLRLGPVQLVLGNHLTAHLGQ